MLASFFRQLSAASPAEAIQKAGFHVGQIVNGLWTVKNDQTTQRFPERVVLSTPSLLNMMEETCEDMTDHVLNPEFSTVGFKVDMKHIAPSFLGDEVHVRAVLTGIDGKRMTYGIEAFTDGKIVGKCRYYSARFLIQATTSEL